MKRLYTIAFLFLICLISTVSCTKDDGSCDHDIYCDLIPYDSGWVDVKVSFKGNGIPIKLYRGFVEENNLLSEDTAYDEVYYYHLPLNQRYTVEAYYHEVNQTIIALNSERLDESTFYNCGDECHEEAEITLDVKKM